MLGKACTNLSHKFGFIRNLSHLDAKNLKNNANNSVLYCTIDEKSWFIYEKISTESINLAKKINQLTNFFCVKLQMDRALAKKGIRQVFPSYSNPL